MSNHRLTLAQQIAELEEPAPIDVDPEHDQGGSPMPFEGAAEAREHYVEVGPSALRRMRDSIADPKYDGVKTSRKQLMEESDVGAEEEEEDGQSDDLDVDEEGSEANGQSEHDDQEDDLQSPSEREDEQDSEDEREEPPITGERETTGDAELVDDLSSTLRQKREEDRRKGKAVSRQLALWDSLLDARIRLQKSVVAANNLPPASEIPEFLADPKCLAAHHAMLSEALLLSSELSLLREELAVRDDVRPAKRRRVREPVADIDGSDQDWAGLLKEEAARAAEQEHAYHAHLTHTLAKWSAKVAAVAPAALVQKSRNAFSGKAGGVKTAGAQVDEALAADGAKLLARTRVRRGKGGRVTLQHAQTGVDGENGRVSQVEEGDDDVEVFDDTDFYQQLLRDVIDARSGSGRAGDDWMASQRQKKAKKSVDTKASKGRKLRYEVHEKIQNFMVPVPLPSGAWHEAQIDELFASLLGKGFEGAAAGEEMEDVVSAVAEPPAEVLKGFRVFG
ncbi:TRAUB-domain-containing protein [Auriscalpium vulgare]|uniref:TRAUB-domain-containing protein n=1 Tax=Auriscalpium vulgare TaxID=40419 RepID=A0ACB8RLG0_9AGAM|nr:TRAUB-domain-containing protein [Auriscalpium vulgare]